MADYETSGGMSHDTGQNALTLGLAFLAGGGVILMIIALTIGVVDPNAGDVVGLMFIVGLLAFIAGGVAWTGVVRPFENFDDINVGIYEGHHHDDHAEDHVEDHAQERITEDKIIDDAHGAPSHG